MVMAKKAKKEKPIEVASDIRKVVKVETQVSRIVTNLATYRNAVTSAENLFSPQRYTLYQHYQQSMLDAHLTAAIQQWKNLVMGREFCVFNSDGKENEEKTKLIRTKWFRDHLDLSLDSVIWGHSLEQFGDIISVNGQDEFKDVELVPRIYVKPEFHIVTKNYGEVTGTDYLDSPYRNWCIGVGKPRDLGLLLKATPLCIWKKNAIGTWAEFIEKFGVPIRIGKTNTRDEPTRLNMFNTLQNMKVALFAVIDPDDDIELKETTNQDAFEVFNQLIERCNSEMSKLILGQTMTMDAGASLSQSEVHERVLQGYAEHAEKFIYGVNNYQLVPVLNALNFGLEGMTIGMEPEDQFTVEERSKFDIEILKSGKFTFTPEYIKDNYGSEVIKVEEPVEPEAKQAKTIKNKLDELYS